MAISVAAGAIVFGFAIGSAMNWLAIVAAAFLVVGLGAIGRMVLQRDRRSLGAHPGVRRLPPRARDALVPDAAADRPPHG